MANLWGMQSPLNPKKSTKEEVPVRQTLLSYGFPNKNIGWNQQAGTFSLTGPRGTFSFEPTSVFEGRSYAKPQSITQMLSTVGYNPIQQRFYNDPNSPQNILSRLLEMQSEPFDYDPSSDPYYKSAKSEAQRGASKASRTAREDLNRRGILNSTVTADRLGQIQQEYNQRVNELIPQFMSQAWGRRQDELSNLMEALSASAGLDELRSSTALKQGELMGSLFGVPTLQSAVSERELGLKDKQLNQELDIALQELGLGREELALAREKLNAQSPLWQAQALNYLDSIKPEDDISEEDRLFYQNKMATDLNELGSNPSEYQIKEKLHMWEAMKATGLMPASLADQGISYLNSLLTDKGKGKGGGGEKFSSWASGQSVDDTLSFPGGLVNPFLRYLFE